VLKKLKNRLDGFDEVGLSLEVPLRHVLPFEMQPPIKPTPDQRGGSVLEGVGVDDVDDGRDHRVGLLLDSGQQRLQPAFVHFDVAVQKHQHLPQNINKYQTAIIYYIRHYNKIV